ncbi:M48 family metallopeptidase [Palleronia sp.]|uniref:M48 family metallopeptidase n=1 Tax=Palleronia sp. TaxID=1940284 RepID=UPI0035C834C4
MRAFAFSILVALTAAACTPTLTPVPRPVPAAPPPSSAPGPRAAIPPEALPLVEVVNRVMPVAVSACRSRGTRQRCDFLVALDDSRDVEPNAFQTLSPDGRPVIGFTLPLVQQTRNEDELAFILAHEAAHHIAGHIARGQNSARIGADLIGGLVAASGGGEVAIREAQGLGAFLGARRYAQDFELEADSLGALIAQRAGYDPQRGVMFFQNAPDPGSTFLGTHPPNAARIEVVRRTIAGS